MKYLIDSLSKYIKVFKPLNWVTLFVPPTPSGTTLFQYWLDGVYKILIMN